jgi:diaminohydroxyphosphoribosylaminopyrimidine deaminase/5-amino-6-(5-phosphoribosylamino)uracil reductase
LERIVVGMRHPLPHFRGKAIAALRRAGARVEVGGEGLGSGAIAAALKACEYVNAPLLYRAWHNLPMSTLKYAMTLDGKIAASSGHAAWVSSAVSRERVFKTRAQSDAVIVGGNTVRSDNPSLTTRQETGHQPDRIVMSRALDLPREANLWNVSKAHTIVMTQKGARPEFQKYLASRGVEVVEFDSLSPRAVMEHCYLRGYLSVLWECGGTLSAPAIQGSVIHKVLAFVAPKIVGGLQAPTPVGELGMVQMTQALKLSDVTFEQTGPDMLVTGYLQPIPDPFLGSNDGLTSISRGEHVAELPSKPSVIRFNKPWDRYGALSTLSHHPITLPDCDGKPVLWSSVEHYYQASKFAGVNDPLAVQCRGEIQAAESPEEAARLGESLSRQRPDLLRKDWDIVKLQVMRTALQAKFLAYPALKSFLVSTEGSVLVESSQNDSFWGASKNGVGLNHLGRLLMDLRAELRRVPLSDGLINGHSTSVNGSQDLFDRRRQQVASS